MKITKDKLKQIVREELASITENSNKFFIVDPTGMRGEPAYYRRLATNDDSQFEFSTLWGATGFDSKGSANTTMRRIKNSSRKYRGANLKVLRGDELHEEIEEATDTTSIQKQIDQAEKYLKSIHGNSSSVKMKKFAIQKKIDKLKKQLEEDVEEGMGLVLNKEIFFGLQKLISKNAKNNKLKGYSSEVSHAVTDILVAVEEDRLAIGDVFNGLKTITRKIEK